MLLHARAAALVLVCAHFTAAADNAKDDSEKLQGAWRVVGVEINGEKASEEQIKKANYVITFSGKSLVAESNGKKTDEATFTLDSSKKPKTIDTTSAEKGSEKGIYELDGDSLKICVSTGDAERPKDFKTAGTKNTLLILQREKPKEK